MPYPHPAASAELPRASCSGGLGVPPSMPPAPSMHPTGRPLISLKEVDTPSSWKQIGGDGNLRVCMRHNDASDAPSLWLVVTDVPAPPATVAAGFRQLVRTWGVHDAILRNITVLSDGGGVPPFVTDCACCFEQLFQVLPSLP